MSRGAGPWVPGEGRGPRVLGVPGDARGRQPWGWGDPEAQPGVQDRGCGVWGDPRVCAGALGQGVSHRDPQPPVGWGCPAPLWQDYVAAGHAGRHGCRALRGFGSPTGSTPPCPGSMAPLARAPVPPGHGVAAAAARGHPTAARGPPLCRTTCGTAMLRAGVPAPSSCPLGTSGASQGRERWPRRAVAAGLEPAATFPVPRAAGILEKAWKW